MNIVFYGSSDFSLEALKVLISAQDKCGYNVVGIVTSQDPNVSKNSYYDLAKENNIKLVKENSLDFVKRLKPDVCIVASYGRILKPEELNIPKYGFLNIHPSSLPILRGAIPMQMALYLGFKKTGVTILTVAEKFDSGKILIQEEADILDNDNLETLSYRLFEQGGELLLKVLNPFVEGTLKLQDQDDSKATYGYIRDIEKIKDVNLDMDAKQIERSYRALYPYDYISLNIKGFDVLLIEVNAVDLQENAKVGDIVSIKKDGQRRIYAKCKTGFLELVKVKPKDKNVMNGADFWNGYLKSDKN